MSRASNQLCYRRRISVLALVSTMLASQTFVTQAGESPRAKATILSLRELAQNLDAAEAFHFRGITRIYGFLLAEDERGRDCLLIGRKEPNRPALRLDDFAVAYENVKRSPQRPACTIDPRQDVMRRANEIGRQIMGSRDMSYIEQRLSEFEKIARSDQDVRVFGIAPHTNYSRVMVDADYFLKNVCNGEENLPGVTSLTDLVLAETKKQIVASGGVSMPFAMYNRFWFNAGEVEYQTSGDRYLLTKCQVRLSTEAEAVTPTGTRTGSSKPDPYAKKFADNVTANYRQVAENKALYRQLENLYRHLALADLLRQDGIRPRCESVVEKLLSHVNVEKVAYRKTLPGKYALARLDGKIPVSGGWMQYQLRLPSCGGVLIDIHIRPSNQRVDRSGRLAEIGDAILRSRPSPLAVVWECYCPVLFEIVS